MEKKFKISVTMFLLIETIVIFVVVSLGRNLLEAWLASIALADPGLTITRIAYLILAMAVALACHLRIYNYLKKNGNIL